MKRNMILLLLVILITGQIMPVAAIESTTYTYTFSTDFHMIRTQDAYMPGSVILREASLKSPEDLHIQGKWLYVADTGNKRVLRYDLITGEIQVIGEGLLQSPTGVYASQDGRLFVADYAASLILVFDHDGKHLNSIGKPDTSLYGSKAFKPQKVAADQYGNLYITAESNYEGILQYDINGNFAGFFGSNKADGLSLVEWVQDTFFTEEQKQKLFLRNPPRIVNLEVSKENLVYSVTQLFQDQALKKLNMAGVNILNAPYFLGERFFVDVALLPGLQMVAVTDTGAIVEYDAQGRYLFGFGGRAISADRNGLTSVVSSISSDEQGNLYILDKQRGVVQPYRQTDFARRIHEGLAFYQQGRYAEAAEIWQEYIRLTPRAAFAHWGYGLALWQMEEYSKARYHLEMVQDMDYVSDAFWEQRNAWLQDHLGGILLLMICLFALYLLLKRLRHRFDFLKPIIKGWQNCKARSSLIQNLLDTRQMICHPIDTTYDLKHKTRGSVGAAGILYLLAVGVWLLDAFFSATLFNSRLFIGPWTNPLIIISSLVVPGALFILGNYFISSINDGEGRLSHVYIVLAYSLSPYILFTPFITLLTHSLTLNESFINNILRLVTVGYTGVVLFVAIQETHRYSFGQTVKNILLTLCFVVLVILAMMILYMMWNELIGFVKTLVEEVSLRG